MQFDHYSLIEPVNWDAEWQSQIYVPFITTKFVQANIYDDKAVMSRLCLNPVMFEYIVNNYEARQWSVDWNSLSSSEGWNCELISRSGSFKLFGIGIQ